MGIIEAYRRAVSEEPGLRPGLPRETAEEILRYGAVVGAGIEHLSKAARCMDLARERISQAEAAGRSFVSGPVIVADELTGGKGRFSRQWYAPPGGLWLVLTLVNILLPEHAALYPLAAGVACGEAIRHHGLPATLKWVNYVMLGGKKLAGILTETMIGPVSGEEYVLIGIGINVNNTSFAPELRHSAGAMAQFGGRDFDLAEVGGRLLAKLAWNIGLLHWAEAKALAGDRGLEEEMPHPMIRAWLGLSDTVGRKVRFGFNVAERPHYCAKVVAIDNLGQLVLRLADGQETRESGGEIVYL